MVVTSSLIIGGLIGFSLIPLLVACAQQKSKQDEEDAKTAGFCVAILWAIAAVIYACSASSSSETALTELNKSFDIVLSEFMIPPDQVSVYRKYYDMVQAGFEDVDAEFRDISTSIHTLTVPKNNIDNVIGGLIEEMYKDLGKDPRTDNVVGKIENLRKNVKWGVLEDMAKITRINLVHKFGGKSDIIVGAVGYREKGGDNVEIGISVYREVWKLSADDRLIERAKEWKQDAVTKYGFYALLLPK